MSPWTAGFGTADVTPPVGAAIPGGFAPQTSTDVLDPLQARAAVLSDGRSTLAVVGVDAVSLNFETVAAARRAIAEQTGLAERHILIAASHTHSGGPANDVLGTAADPAHLAQLADGIAAAVRQAQAARQPAEVGWVRASCPGWAFNRRFTMRDGSERTNPGKGNPDLVAAAGPTDPEVLLLACRTPAGRLLGAVGNFACHCTVVGGSRFSGDYPAAWQAALRRRLGDAFTLVFCNGACGDLNQLDFTNPDVRESGPDWAAAMGDALAASAVAALPDTAFGTPALATAQGEVALPYRQPSAAELEAARALVATEGNWTSAHWLARDLLLLDEQIAGQAALACPVDVFRIGEGVIAAAPWQPFCEYGLRLKAAWPGPAMVATFANGMIGYVPTPQAFAGGGYEPTLCRGSKLQPEAGDLVVAETLRLLKLLDG